MAGLAKEGADEFQPVRTPPGDEAVIETDVGCSRSEGAVQSEPQDIQSSVVAFRADKEPPELSTIAEDVELSDRTSNADKQLQREIAEHTKTRQQVVELQKVNTKLHSELSSVKAQLITAKVQLNQTLSEALRARQAAVNFEALEKMSKEINKLKHKNSQLAYELTELSDAVMQLEADKSKLQELNFVAEAEKAQLAKIVHDITNEVKQLKADKKKLEADLAYSQCIFEELTKPGSFNIMNYAAQSENWKCRVCYRESNPEECSQCNRSQKEHEEGDKRCVAFKERKISQSHAYGNKLLRTACRGNDPVVWLADVNKAQTPTQCKWLQQCNGCDSATGRAESNFDEAFGITMHDPGKYYPPNLRNSCGQIQVDDADLFHVYTFRALCHNVNISHYTNQSCTSSCVCHELLPEIQGFLKKAHHLCQPVVWNGRPPYTRELVPPSSYIDPPDAGMLFYLRQSPVPIHHLIEFPIICEVQYEDPQHSTSEEGASLSPPVSTSSCTLIYAQIPPFYWAFPLVMPDSGLPPFFPEVITKAQDLVANYYKATKTEAKKLQPYFPAIIDAVTDALEKEKVTSLQKWRCNEHKKIKGKIAVKKTERETLKEDKKKNDLKLDSIRARRKSLEDKEKILREKEQDLQTTSDCTKSEKHKLEHQTQAISAQRKKLHDEVLKLNTEDSDLRHHQIDIDKKLDELNKELKDLAQSYGMPYPKLILRYLLSSCFLKVTCAVK